VLRAALTYLALTWLLVQIGDIIFPALNLPDWTITLLIVLLVFLFPVALLLAWIYEMGPKGFIKTSSEEAKENPLTGHRRKPFTSNLVIGILLIAMVGQFVYFKYRYIPPFLAGLDKSSVIKIAVLPLTNTSPDKSLEYFTSGVTQEITDELALVKQFQLTPFASAARYKGSNKKMKEIASELEVSLILSGSGRIDDDRVRLSMELIDPETNKIVWSNRYDDKLTSSITIQNRVAKQIVQGLNIKLSPEEKEDLERINTGSHEAFNLLLRAKAEFRGMPRSEMHKVTSMLERAIELDPSYSQAYSMLSWVHFMYGFGGWKANQNESLRKAKSLIDKAIELDGSNSDSFLVKGGIELFVNNNPLEAKKHIDKALEINSWPKIPINLCMCVAMSTYISLKLLKQSDEIGILVRKVDPLNGLIHQDEGIIHFLKGDIDLAMKSFQTGVAISSSKALGSSFWLGWAYYNTGEYDKALIHLEGTTDANSGFIGISMAYLSNSYYKMGNMEKSNQYRDILLSEQLQGRKNLNLPLSIITAARGDKENAHQFLEQATKENEFGLAYYVSIILVFDEFRDDTEFIKLMNKVSSKNI